MNSEQTTTSEKEFRFRGDHQEVVAGLAYQRTLSRSPAERENLKIQLDTTRRNLKKQIFRERQILSLTRMAIEEKLTTEPNISIDKLLGGLNMAQFPTVVQGMISEIVKDLTKNMAAVRKVNEKLLKQGEKAKNKDHETDSAEKSAGRTVFWEISKRKPEGLVLLKESKLAVWIEVFNGSDFELLDQRKNVAGHYNRQAKIGGEFCPIIVTKADSSELAIKHEEAHGQHSHVGNGLYQTDINNGVMSLFRDKEDVNVKRFWGRGSTRQERFFIPTMLAKMAEVWPIKALRQPHEWLNKLARQFFESEIRDLLKRCEENAKDEILAELYNGRSGGVRQHLENLKKIKTQPADSHSNHSPETNNLTIVEPGNYDWLTEAGLLKLESHPLFGVRAKEARIQYYSVLDRNVKPIVELTDEWNAVGLGRDGFCEKYLYGMLIPTEGISGWGKFIKRNFPGQINEIRKLVDVEADCRKSFSTLYAISDGYAGVGLTEQRDKVDRLAESIEKEMGKVFGGLREEAARDHGAVDKSDFQLAQAGILAIQQQYASEVADIGKETRVFNDQYAEKATHTRPFELIQKVNTKEDELTSAYKTARALWDEQNQLIHDFEKIKGVDLFTGIVHLDQNKSLPLFLEIKTQDPSRFWEQGAFVTKHVPYNNPGTRKLVEDFARIRQFLNSALSNTSYNELAKQLWGQSDSLRKIVVQYSNEGGMQYYVRMNSAISETQDHQVGSIVDECDQVLGHVKLLVENARQILDKYQIPES